MSNNKVREVWFIQLLDYCVPSENDDYQDNTVTKQTGAQSCGALTHDPTISIEGNRFLLTGVQPWGAESTPAQSPPPPWNAALPLLPKRYQPKPCPEVPHILICSVQTGLHPLWKVLSLYVVVQKTCAMLHWVMEESREAHVPREWLLLISFREAEFCNSAFPVTVQLHASPTICAWSGRSPHSSISSATIFSFLL